MIWDVPLGQRVPWLRGWAGWPSSLTTLPLMRRARMPQSCLPIQQVVGTHSSVSWPVAARFCVDLSPDPSHPGVKRLTRSPAPRTPEPFNTVLLETFTASLLPPSHPLRAWSALHNPTVSAHRLGCTCGGRWV